MASKIFTRLDDRSVLALSGPDTVPFLQGIVTNDVARAGPRRAVYTALLTPQGKYLFDFIVFGRDGGGVWLDCARARLDDLRRRLAMYRLRAKVEIGAEDGLAIFALWGDGTAEALGLADEPGVQAPFDGGLACIDPRLAAAGARAILPAATAAEALGEAGFAAVEPASYERHRLGLGLPADGVDLVPEKSLPLECNLEELNGIAFDKGCYVGQEVTARMKHRNLVRKRLLPVTIEGNAPPPGTPVTAGAAVAGELRSALDGVGLALLKLDGLAGGAPLVAGEARLRPRAPGWARAS